MKILKTILKILGWILGVLVLVVAVALVVFTIAEYRPADVETVIPEQQAEAVLETGKPLTIVSWNCGYGALGDNAEFFMDGGTSVYTADKERVTSNLDGIREKLQALSPDFIILQEVDINSSRSYGIDERAILRDVKPGAPTTSTPCISPIRSRPSAMWKAACIPSAPPSRGSRNGFPCRYPSPGPSGWSTSNAACWSAAIR